jgi:hypothetical protein
MDEKSSVEQSARVESEPWNYPDWKNLVRTTSVTLLGRTIEALSAEAIVGMYPDLRASKWWVDQSEDLYLSVFFSNPTELGTIFKGKFYGVASWRVKLYRRFGLQDVWEMLERFSQPMNGQQKNLLVALTTLAQVKNVKDVPPITQSVLNLQELTERPKILPVEQVIPLVDKPFIKTARRMDRLPFFVAHSGCTTDVCSCDLHIHTLGLGKKRCMPHSVAARRSAAEEASNDTRPGTP